MKPRRMHVATLLLAALLPTMTTPAQDILGMVGDPVAAKVETVYARGIRYLLAKQTKAGSWTDNYGSQPGVIGLAVLAMLAHGEDPNYGPCAEAIQLAVGAMLKQQHAASGYLGSSMYNHGFATLALAEVYGMLDDERIGPALERAVYLILSAQTRNPNKAWRYNPQSNDADTTVSGACMVALFAARNAGIEIPNRAVSDGLSYFRRCACPGGGFGYTGPSGPNGPRAAIGALVFALDGRDDDPACQASVSFLKARLTQVEPNYRFYHLYYMAQAMFRNDMKAWQKWDSLNLERLAAAQRDDGSWHSSHGDTFGTAAALLSLALNYRFLPIYER